MVIPRVTVVNEKLPITSVLHELLHLFVDLVSIA